MWMQTGSGKRSTTKWGGGSLACKTSFKSEMWIKTKNNKRVNATTEKGQYVFSSVNAGDTIHYKVETGADKSKPASDKFSFIVTSINWTYLISVSNEMMASATESELKLWNSNKDAYIDALSKKIDMSRYIMTIFSELKQTGENGIYEGSVKVPNTWASGPVSLSLFYGYDKDLTTSDFSRTFTSTVNTIGWITLGIGLIAFTIATFGVGGTVAAGITAVAGSTAVLVADAVEIGLLIHEHLQQGLTAQIGRNKYGCSFPQGGYLHTYDAIIVNPNKDPFKSLNQSSLPESVEGFSIGSFTLNKQTAYILLAGGGFIWIIASLVGGSNDGN